jgi:shikimate dehydrogenase
MPNKPFATYHLGLTGYPLGHSLSPKIHAAALKSCGLSGDYSLFPIPPDDLPALQALLSHLRKGELNGLNVTIPHKQTVIPYLDDLTPSARAIGAVNTIFTRDGKLIGHNTDAPGFLADLKRLLEFKGSPLDLREQAPALQKSALVLGAGGAARAVVSALLSEDWMVTLAVRADDVEQANQLIDSMPRSSMIFSYIFSNLHHLDLSFLDLIVNATPLGMSPHIETCSWPEDLEFPQNAAVYDCVYNPRETLLVKRARAAGLPASTGLGMLVEQAALAFETWTGQLVPREVLFQSVEN